MDYNFIPPSLKKSMATPLVPHWSRNYVSTFTEPLWLSITFAITHSHTCPHPHSNTSPHEIHEKLSAAVCDIQLSGWRVDEWTHGYAQKKYAAPTGYKSVILHYGGLGARSPWIIEKFLCHHAAPCHCRQLWLSDEPTSPRPPPPPPPPRSEQRAKVSAHGPHDLYKYVCVGVCERTLRYSYDDTGPRVHN